MRSLEALSASIPPGIGPPIWLVSSSPRGVFATAAIRPIGSPCPRALHVLGLRAILRAARGANARGRVPGRLALPSRRALGRVNPTIWYRDNRAILTPYDLATYDLVSFSAPLGGQIQVGEDGVLRTFQN